MDKRTVIVLEGDQTGQELLEEALRVLHPNITRANLEFERFNLSLDNRRKTKNKVVHEAAERIKQTGLGIKAATITPADPTDVGSPNALLRELIDGQVILRTGRRIPGVRPIAGVYAPISVVRMARDDAYGAKEWREGEEGSMDEMAYRTEKISRRVCRAVAQYAFQHARDTGAKVFGGPKFTVSPVYEGMFKEEMDATAKLYPDVRYEPQLIDATFALLLATTGDKRSTSGAACHGSKFAVRSTPLCESHDFADDTNRPGTSEPCSRAYTPTANAGSCFDHGSRSMPGATSAAAS